MKRSAILQYIFVAILSCGLSFKAYSSEFELKTSFTVLSEYYSRGITQTQGLIAPQLETTLSHESGLFAGMFVSRVEFLDGNEADLELDYYIAYHQTVDDWYYRIGGIYFTYPNADNALNYDFFELDVGLGHTFDPIYTELSLRASPNHFGSSGIERYVKFQAVSPIIDKVNVKGHIAHRYVEDNDVFFNIPDSFDWELGLEYSPATHTNLILKHVNSNLSRRDCLGRGFCNGRIVSGVKFTF